MMTGKIIAEKYEILRRVAIGGMSEVYLATQIGLDRQVIVKKLLPGLDVRSTIDLREEGRIMAQIDHANVVGVVDLVEHEGDIYLVQLYFESRSLREVLRRLEESEQHMSSSRIRKLVAQIAAAIRAIHRAGIVHGDIKPENILVNQDNIVKLCDFGISRVVKTGGAYLTTISGSLPYMAPELLGAKPVLTKSADFYAFGCVLFELLELRPVFGLSDDQGLIELVTRKTADDRHLPTARCDLTEQFAPDIERLLSPNPEGREAAFGEISNRVVTARSSPAERDAHASSPVDTDETIVSVRTTVQRAIEPPPGGGVVKPSKESDMKQARKERIRRMALIAIVAVILAGGGIGGVAIYRSRAYTASHEFKLENLVGTWLMRTPQYMQLEFTESGSMNLWIDLNSNQRFDDGDLLPDTFPDAAKPEFRFAQSSPIDGYDGTVRNADGAVVLHGRLGGGGTLHPRATRLTVLMIDENTNRTVWYFSRVD